MALNKAEEDPNAVFKYEEVEVRKVDLVGGPATGDKFIVIRDDGSENMARRAMTKRAIDALGDDSSESKSVPIVARQDAAEAAVEAKSETPKPASEEKQDRVTPSEVEGENLPVERTEDEPKNISEETQMSVEKLTGSVDRLANLVERMEGTFTNVLGAAGAEAPVTEEDPEPVVEDTPVPVAEDAPVADPVPAPQEAPVVPVAPVPVASAPAPPPVETPQEAPVAAEPEGVPAPAGDITQAVTTLADVVERMGKTINGNMESLNAKIDGMGTRVNKVERSVLSGGNADQDDTETEAPVERSDQSKPGLFSNIFHSQ